MRWLSRFWLLSGLASGVVVLVVALGLSYFNLSSYSTLVEGRLVLLNDLRRGALQQYFSTASAELQFWATDPEIIRAQKQFASVWQSSTSMPAARRLKELYVRENPHQEGAYRNLDDAGDGSTYSAVHSDIHPMVKLFVTQRGYYDVFLIGPAGNIFYSVEKEADFATNLNTGPWKESSLGKVFRRAMDAPRTSEAVLSDLQTYEPSSGAPAMFVARAMRDTNGEVLGVLAFQIPTSQIVKIMNYTSGMGESGETYIVGQDGLMRSNSRFSSKSTILSQSVTSDSAKLALAGEQGVGMTVDYRGVEVLSAYSSVKVGDTSWAVLAEIDHQEVVADAAQLRPGMSGILMLFYGLSLWSIWYWRARDTHTASEPSAGIELSDSISDLASDGIGA